MEFWERLTNKSAPIRIKKGLDDKMKQNRYMCVFDFDAETGS